MRFSFLGQELREKQTVARLAGNHDSPLPSVPLTREPFILKLPSTKILINEDSVITLRGVWCNLSANSSCLMPHVSSLLLLAVFASFPALHSQQT